MLQHGSDNLAIYHYTNDPKNWSHLRHGRVYTVCMIGTWTCTAVYQVGPLLSPAHQTVPQAGCLVNALITIPEIWSTLYSIVLQNF